MSWPSPTAFREPEPDTPVVTPTDPQLSQELLSLSVSAVTLPLLGGVVLSRWTLASLIQLGRASEELFRGDRLPLLKDSLEENRS